MGTSPASVPVTTSLLRVFDAAAARATSLSFVLLYINFLMHLSQSTTFTNALFDSPFSI